MDNEVEEAEGFLLRVAHTWPEGAPFLYKAYPKQSIRRVPQGVYVDGERIEELVAANMPYCTGRLLQYFDTSGHCTVLGKIQDWDVRIAKQEALIHYPGGKVRVYRTTGREFCVKHTPAWYARVWGWLRKMRERARRLL